MGDTRTMTLTDFLLARIAEDEVSEATEHGDHFSPRRIVAECEAKRQIVEDATGQHTSCPELDQVCRILAAIYSDHPDFDPAWR